jgi:hypothetical protein
LAVVLAVTTGSPWLSGTARPGGLGPAHRGLEFSLLLAVEIEALRAESSERTWREGLRWGLSALAPIVISGMALLGYNYVRFNHPLDFGYQTQNIAPELAGDRHAFGQFSLHYVPHNLWAMLLAGPVFDPKTNSIAPSLDGMSLLLTTPALLYVVGPSKRLALVIGAWISVGLLLIPLLTYYNTGWWQFGYRFSLDCMTPLLVLLALRAGSRVAWPMRALIVLGVLVNAWGVLWFLNPGFFSYAKVLNEYRDHLASAQTRHGASVLAGVFHRQLAAPIPVRMLTRIACSSAKARPKAFPKRPQVITQASHRGQGQSPAIRVEQITILGGG